MARSQNRPLSSVPTCARILAVVGAALLERRMIVPPYSTRREYTPTVRRVKGTSWQRCQEVKDQRIQPWMRGPRARARVYLFSGVPTCNRCGWRYRGKPATARGRFYQMLLHT